MWISGTTPDPMRCGQCGAVAPFIRKRGLRCITLFFIVPVLPISAVKDLVECPNCRTRYRAQWRPPYSGPLWTNQGAPDGG